MTGSQIIYSIALVIWVIFSGALIAAVGRYESRKKPGKILEYDYAAKSSLALGLMLFGAARIIEIVLELLVAV